ncbi:VOC family protein [Maribacter ulvicola]|uniref:Glyoxalase/Bleomycin resistance protein/Dioxygenase superfamily protein n=1 Tax=Maribacter ulvicola TaxID=228959 RepID=A0A1N6RWF2_9FLAO|nr:VOC family protein [Maribacter ulvicola]SIQ33183.1 Glyoxalase/Bleomycin resistance protein/Dioxygenase superfamily protein [Maribacter ulvicola]
MNLNQVTVPSLNVTKSISFYKKLGLQLIVKSLPNYARFECPDGTSTFSIHLVDELPDGAGIYVYFECEDLDEQVTLLKSNGLQFDQEPKNERWLWREARLKDLDGNQLILFYGGKNRLNPPWRLEEK